MTTAGTYILRLCGLCMLGFAVWLAVDLTRERCRQRRAHLHYRAALRRRFQRDQAEAQRQVGVR